MINPERIIMGDFNTNVQGIRPNSLKKGLDSYMESLNLKQLMSEPARVTKTSSSIINLIIVSDINKLTC